jgi:hypothetical protein
MNKNTQMVLGGLGVIIAGYFVYKNFFLSKEKKATLIVEKGYASDVKAIMGFDDSYVNAWYKSAKQGNDKFVINGVTYNTEGGKVSQARP